MSNPKKNVLWVRSQAPWRRSVPLQLFQRYLGCRGWGWAVGLAVGGGLGALMFHGWYLTNCLINNPYIRRLGCTSRKIGYNYIN